MPTRSMPASDVRPLGPGAVAWYAASDLRALLMAIRVLVLQTAHPMVGAGVLEHSVYKTDPWGRLWRSLTSVMHQVFGGRRTAEEGERLRRVHAEIKGKDAQGRRYSALDPDAFLWVHATLFDAWRVFLRDYGPGLSPAQEAQLFDEWRRVGLLIGCKERLLPIDVTAFDAYWAAMLPTLEDNPVVQDVLHNGPRKPRWLPLPSRLFDLANAPLLLLQRSFVTETLPPELAALFGLERTRRTARHERLLRRFSKLLGFVPGPLRRSPFALWWMWRTSRDPLVTPEPVRYP